MMKNTETIISILDHYMIENNLASLTAVEAAELLDKRGILKDSKLRKGLPLRNILRDGGIPHAYQIGNRWHIPRSSRTSGETTELKKSRKG